MQQTQSSSYLSSVRLTYIVRKVDMRPSRRSAVRRALTLTLVAGLALTGCQTGDPQANAESQQQIELPPLTELTPVDDPSAVEGPTTAVIGGPTMEPVADNPEPDLPVTVTSHDRAGDTEITVTD